MTAEPLQDRDVKPMLDIMRRVPRHKFIRWRLRRWAYVNVPLPIGYGQTISQPHLVALMTQLVEPDPADKALDIGTGSGYQAALLADLVKEVYSVEIIEPLAKTARDRLESLGYKNIHLRHGDGYRGWPARSPFDIIIVAAASDHVPQPLMEQLAPGGRMVIPVGTHHQYLRLIKKADDGSVSQHNVAPVSFVPLTGEARRRPAPRCPF